MRHGRREKRNIRKFQKRTAVSFRKEKETLKKEGFCGGGERAVLTRIKKKNWPEADGTVKGANGEGFEKASKGKRFRNLLWGTPPG